jgi:benzoyl-CoA reductase/2-hydroxyglutaryl-CoA dehydratase subunit BcrC/BadD/HgdB
MNDLLWMCGYEPEELERELPRVRKAFARLGITDDDVARGKERISKFYDMDLKGVRRLLGLFVKELVNITLARDEGRDKIIHTCMASGFEAVSSAIVTFSKDVFVAVPNPPFMVVFGVMFGKFIPILEAAEDLWLKGGLVAHCAMVKCRVGLISLGLVPRPDVMVTSGFLCDTSAKTNDLLGELYGTPMIYFDTCQDREAWEQPDADRPVLLAAKSMRKASEDLGKLVGFQVQDDMVWEVLRARAKYGASVEKLRNLVRESDPVPFASTHENLFSWISPVALSLETLAVATEAVDTLYGELKDRVDKGVGVTTKGAPKILGILPNHHSDPRLEQLFNELDMAIVAFDYELSVPTPSSLRETKDPYEAVSLRLLGSMAEPPVARVGLITEACKRWHIDGVLDHYHVGCRTVAGDALIIHEALARELGIPVLLLEWENFDPRVFHYEEYRARLEMFKSMIEGRRQGQSGS